MPRRKTTGRPRGRPRKTVAPVSSPPRIPRTPVLSDDVPDANCVTAPDVHGPALDVKKALDEAVTVIRRKYGVDSIRLIEPVDTQERILVVPTGFTVLDRDVFGTGGLPLGRIVHVSGRRSAGKSMFAKFLIACAQRDGVATQFEDAERSDVPGFSQAIGVLPEHGIETDPDALVKPLEQVFEEFELGLKVFVKRDVGALQVLDSIAATPLAMELQRDYDEALVPGKRAAFLSFALRRYRPQIRQSKVGLLLVNQIRDIIGAAPFQKPTYSPGGHALHHYTDIELELTFVGKIMGQGGVPIGIKTRIRCEKNKLAPPFRETTLALMFDGHVREADE